MIVVQLLRVLKRHDLSANAVIAAGVGAVVSAAGYLAAGALFDAIAADAVAEYGRTLLPLAVLVTGLALTAALVQAVNARTARRENEGLLRAFMDNSPVVMSVKDLDGRYLVVNQRVEKAWSRPAADILGRRSVDLMSAAGTQAIHAMEREVVRTGKAVSKELHFPERPGLVWSYEVKFPILDAAGGMVAIGGATLDISELKKTEMARQESESLLRGFMENAPVAMSVKDADGRFRLANPWIERTYGLPAAELIGRTVDDLSESPAMRAIREMEREVVATGKTVAREVEFEGRDAFVWHYIVKFPIRDGDGRLHAMGAVGIDISELKKAEMARQESESLLRGFMDNAPFELVVKDLEGRYLMVSREVARAWQMPAESVLGHRASETTIGKGSEVVEAMDREVIATGRPVAREILYPDWGDHWSYEVKFPIRNAAEELMALGGVSLNIAEQKRAEAELIRAKGEAEQGSRAKGQFLANMSHELRTPLNAIIGFSEIIARQLYGPVNPPKYLEYARDIHASGEHLLGIVNNILDTSKIEAGGFELSEEPADIVELLGGAMLMIQERAQDKGVALERRVARRLPAIRVDKRVIRQILLNLLSNAVKFTGPAGRVTLAAERSPDGGLLIQVADNGVGIAPEHLARVFDRFAQFHESLTARHGGTGLGLHVSKKMVELHGGTIALESQPGVGTTVSVTLPPERWCEAPATVSPANAAS